MTFKTWIRRYKDDDSDLGEFANEISTDPDFPRTGKLGEMMEYLFAKDVSMDEIKMFYEAYTEYSYLKR